VPFDSHDSNFSESFFFFRVPAGEPVGDPVGDAPGEGTRAFGVDEDIMSGVNSGTAACSSSVYSSKAAILALEINDCSSVNRLR